MQKFKIRYQTNDKSDEIVMEAENEAEAMEKAEKRFNDLEVRNMTVSKVADSE